MAARTLINVPPKAKRGDVIAIKTLISHTMENGFRHDNTGKPIPRVEGPDAFAWHRSLGHGELGVDAVPVPELLLQSPASLALFPPIEHCVQSLAGDRARFCVEQAGPSKMQHHFGNASGQKCLDGREPARSVRQAIDKPGHLLI